MSQGQGRSPDTDPFNSRGILTDPTAADIGRVERTTREQLVQEAVQNISDVDGQADVIVRDILPDADLASGADNNWDGNDRQWEQNGMGNTGAETANTVYNVDSDNEADDKIIAFYAISNVATSPVTTEIEFVDNTGGVFERLQVEGLLTDDETLGLLADPVVFGASQDGDINQYATGADDNVVYHGAVAEPEGQTLNESGRFLSDKVAGRRF